MVTNLIVSVLVGGLMGLLNHIRRNNNRIKKPKNNKRDFDPGYLTDVLYGSIGAILTVSTGNPEDLMGLLLLAVIGGYAGESTIARLEASNRLDNAQVYQENIKTVNEELPAPKQKKKEEQ